MEINPFILALSKTLPESCLQGLVVYLLFQLLFFIDKRSTPLLKFNVFYLANWCLFAGFVYTFFHHYQQIQVVSFNQNLLPDIIKTNNPTLIVKPNLWLQFSFWTNHYAYLITGFYLLGLLFCILKLIIGLINISWFRSNKNLKLDEYLTQVSIQLSSNFRLIKTVSVFVSDQICVPLTLGFIKPIIVFPIALINQLSAEQTEAILLHELAHIKRNDYLLNLLLCTVQCFLFFNPAIWLMKREINQLREQCCDDLVLDNTQHQLAYARALLLIEASRSTQLTLTLASNGKKYSLLNRIKRITNMKSNEPSPQNKFVVLLLALITICLSVAWNTPVKKAIKNLSFTHFKAVKEALKHLPDHQLTGFKLTVSKPNKPTFSWSADKITIAHSQPNTSHTKIISDSIVFQPDSKSNKKYLFAGKKIVLDFKADTAIKSKNKFKIVLEDSVGNRKEYNSIEELPADEQKEFLKENGKLNGLHGFKYIPNLNGGFQAIPKFDDTSNYALVRKYYNSPEWKKKEDAINKMGRDVDNYYNSPEWKKKMADIKIYGEKLRKQFNSPEWKKQQEDFREQDERLRKQMSNPEFRKQVEEIQKQFNSPEWKKQMDDIRKQSEKLTKQFNSKKWKRQMEKLQKNSIKYNMTERPKAPEKPEAAEPLEKF